MVCWHVESIFKSYSEVWNVSMHSNTNKSSLVLSRLLHRFFSCGHDGSSSRFGLVNLKIKFVTLCDAGA